MRTFFEPLIVAFSMYSRIPMPHIGWNKKNMRYSMLFFPLVGVIIAAALYALYILFSRFALSSVFFAAAAVLIPVLITGGIHLDGFCDTCDALSSYGDREKKLSIMKDPHVGAFGVIYTCSILLAQYGAWHQIFSTPDFLISACLTYIISRSLAGLAVIRFQKARGSGLAAAFSEFAEASTSAAVLVGIEVIASLPSLVFPNPTGIFVPISSCLLFLIFYRMSKKQFGGITGDLAGFFITLAETLAIVISAVLGAVIR